MPVIIALEFDSKLAYLDALDIAAYRFKEVDEALRYCLLRERGMEAHVLRSANIPFLAFEKGTGATLDTNLDLDALDKDACRLLVRARSRAFSVPGFKLLLGEQDNDAVEHWPTLIKQPDHFLKRRVDYIDRVTFLKRFEVGTLPFPLFIKGSEKGPDNSTSLRHVFDNQAALREMLIPRKEARGWTALPEDADWVVRFRFPDWDCPYRGWVKGRTEYTPISYDFIASDLMSIERDQEGDNGLREYRCFVFNGKLCSASRYTDYNTLPVPEAVKVFARQFADVHAKVLPMAYVVDIAQTDKGLQVIEINPFTWSGRYLDNQPLPMYRAVHEHYNQDANLPMCKPMPLPEKQECDDLNIYLVSRLDPS